ncbi:MAG: MFS transporter [Athalassotoga sp.]|uniref:MFS transporter n=1 Tax=Athalassotoga sp. TaxID=2022597 RepID=UPI003CFF9E36
MAVQYKWKALSATSLGAFVSVMNSSALLIALPDIAKELNTSMILVIWVIMSYMLSVTILVPAIGRVADIFGRKNLYVDGFALFTVTSFFAGLSQNGPELLILRIVQSVGGALMIANSAAIVTDAFPRKELGRALGINAMVVAVGFTLGPVIGGLLTVALGWRWVFFFNVPLGIIGTIWAWLQIKEVEKMPSDQKFDWFGAITLTGGLFGILMAMSLGGLYGWGSLTTVIGFVVGAILMLVFVYLESRTRDPLLDLTFFKNRLMGFAYTSTLFNGIANGSLTFLLIFYLQGIKSMSPFEAGLMLTPFAIAMMVAAPISGALSDKYGSRELSSIGLLVMAAGLFGFTFINANTSLFEIIFWQMIMGFGSGMFNSPNNNAIMSSVPSNKRGTASGTRVMMNNAGSVVSIAIAFAVTSSGMTPQAMQALFAGIQVGSRGIFVDKFIHDLSVAFYISLFISIAAAILSYMRGKKPEWKEDKEPAKKLP